MQIAVLISNVKSLIGIAVLFSNINFFYSTFKIEMFLKTGSEY